MMTSVSDLKPGTWFKAWDGKTCIVVDVTSSRVIVRCDGVKREVSRGMEIAKILGVEIRDETATTNRRR